MAKLAPYTLTSTTRCRNAMGKKRNDHETGLSQRRRRRNLFEDPPAAG
jgi:hypothetical protein